MQPNEPAAVGGRYGRSILVLVGGLVLLLVGLSAGYLLGAQPTRQGGGADGALATRQAQVANQGAQVMPFDLTRTTHTFTDAADGGVEQVTAHDSTDSSQIDLIRMHLQMEAGRFSAGDFSDPAATHGAQMPGLGTLSAAGDRLRITYESLANGAQLRYSSSDPVVVAALHEWFAAQRTDHGGMSPMSP